MKELEIVPLHETGYQPLVDFESWRVAALKFCEDLRPEQLHTMQKHDETDEVFLLLEGEFVLFLGGADAQPHAPQAVRLEPGRLYVVKRGVWHNHCMKPGGSVLIVENQNTCDDNSPICKVETALFAQALEQVVW